MDPSQMLNELSGIDAGKQLAMLKKMGGRANWDAVLRDELEIVLQDKTSNLFDKSGRRIPHKPDKLRARVCNKVSDKYFIQQPKMETTQDFKIRLEYLESALDSRINMMPISFRGAVERILESIRADDELKQILNGVYLPIVVPKIGAQNLGSVLGWFILAAQKSYLLNYKGQNRKVYNLVRDESVDNFFLDPVSRHEILLRQARQGPVPAVVFPTALQGYSIDAEREQMLTLPNGPILSGIDVPLAIAAYPEEVAAGKENLNMNLSSFELKEDSLSRVLLMASDDDRLDFYATPRNPGSTKAYVYYSGGLVFIE